MAKGIKGITVEIGGNTGPLDKALGEVNKKSRSLQVELRQVEKLLKFDPGNTELLAQKQQLLSQSISTTEDKLESLREAQRQVQAQFERGEIGEEQYRALSREIIKTEQDLEKLKDATRSNESALESYNNTLNNSEDALRNNSDELEKYKGKLNGSVKVVGAGLLATGAAAVTASGYALNLSVDFDKAFNTLITKTGASTEEFDSLNTSMENVYKNNFGESIEDVAQSMATVKVNTKLMGKELETATERALLLRDTFEFDVNESTRSAKMLMDQFGLSSDEAFNLIAQGAQKGLDKNGDLLDTINEYGVHFSQMGVSADEMFNMLVNGAQEGTFSVDKLGDAVKEFGIRVKDGTADDTFKALGLSVDETTKKFGEGGFAAREAMMQVTDALFSVEDPIEQNMLGVELFGTMWEDLGATGIKSLMDVQGEIDRTSTSLDNINNQKYDDIGSALQGLGRTIEVDVIEPLGDELKPVVEDVISYVKENAPEIKEVLRGIVEKIGEFIGFIVNNSSTIISTITGIATGLLAWNVASMIHGVVGAIKAFKLANEGATVAQWAMNAAMNANPIGIIISIIVGLVAAVMALWATNEDFRNAIIEIWNNIKEVGIACWETICTFFTETIPNAWNSLVSWFQGIPEWFGQLWSSVLAKFEEWGNNVTNFLATTIPQWIENIRVWFSELPYKIGEGLGMAIGAIANWGVETWTYLTTNVPLWIEGVSTWFSELPGKIETWLIESINKVITWGSETYNKARESITNTINSIGIWFSELPKKISTWLTETINKMSTWASDMATKGKQASKDTIDSIILGFKELPGKMLSIGKSVVEGLWNGIVSMKDWVFEKVKGFADGVIDGFRKTFKINSPSKVMIEIGKFIDEGLAEGITNNADSVKDATKKVATMINQEIENVKNQRDKDVANLEKSLKGETKAKQEVIKEQIKLRKKQADEEIKELKKISTMSKEQLQEELNARKEFAKQVNDLSKTIVSALKDKYKSEYEAQQNSINAQIESLDRWKEESIDRINSVYDAKINAIDAELKALDNAEKEKDRQEAEDEDLAKISKLQNAIEFEHDPTNKAQLEKELEKVLLDREKRIEQQAIEDKKEALKDQKTELEEKRKNELEHINSIYNSEKEMYQNRLDEAKRFYDDRITEAKLQAEAEKMIMDRNQKEIIELLNSYSESYKITGQTLGDKLLEGFEPAINGIKNMIASITEEINSARNEALGLASSGRSIVSNNVSNSRTNNYNVSINNSTNSARDIESVLRKMEFSIV